VRGIREIKIYIFPAPEDRERGNARATGRSFGALSIMPPRTAPEFRRAARLFYHLVPFYEVGEGRRAKGRREERGQGMG